MDNTIYTTIDQEKCIGCGLCVDVCPSQTITMVEDKAEITGDRSIHCGHCQAVCPEGAITVSNIDTENSRFTSFEADREWLPFGEFDTPQLVRLMASRRSCRSFKDDTPVDRSILEDLVKIGITAPSGSNQQDWTFTILPTREAVAALTDRIRVFFETLNARAANPLLRNGLKLIGQGQLAAYYSDYYEVVKEGLEDFQKTGRDRLFYGSPAVIAIGSKPGASTPMEDAILAAQNILLAAHSMGLGSCMIGMAVAPMQNDPSIARFIGVPKEERVYAVIALGYPNEVYESQAGRKKIVQRYFEP